MKHYLEKLFMEKRKNVEEIWNSYSEVNFIYINWNYMQFYGLIHLGTLQQTTHFWQVVGCSKPGEHKVLQATDLWTTISLNMEVSIVMGVPLYRWMVFVRENPSRKEDDAEVTLQETSI